MPDGVVLLLGGLGQLGDEPRDPLGPGRVLPRGRRPLLRSSGWANGRVAGSSLSRRIDPGPYRSRIAIKVASSGLLFRNLSRYGSAFLGLIGSEQVVDRVPELERGPRLLGEELRAR